MAQKHILIIAGPNGAGKSTFARRHLQRDFGLSTFINADQIAVELNPSQPEAVAIEAGRLMLKQIDALVRQQQSFAFETTLAGRGFLRRIEKWRADGYRVGLAFLSLPTPEQAMNRVARRVSQGGHDIPEEVIRRRFHAGLKNFDEIYKHRVDYWKQYDQMQGMMVLEEGGDFNDR